MTNILYTANIGKYDDTKAIRGSIGDDWEAVYITDDVYTTPRGWRALWIDRDAFGNLPPVAIARWCKIQPEYWLYPVLQQIQGTIENIVWIDASMNVKQPLDSLIKEHGGEFVTRYHPSHFSIYDELRAIKTHKRPYLDDLRANVDRIEQLYREAGIPDNEEHTTQSGIILRQPTERTRVLQDLWWREMVTPCGHDIPIWRDQIALRVAAWYSGFGPTLVKDFKKWFGITRHSSFPPKTRRRRPKARAHAEVKTTQ